MTGLFLPQAKTAGELTCGTLHGAKFTQLSAANNGNFTLSWIDLGYACDSEIAPYVNSTFNDIFETAPFVNTSATPCPSGFTSINSGSCIENWGLGCDCDICFCLIKNG